MTENHTLRANFTALCVTEAELLLIKAAHCGISVFFFCSRNPELDRMTFNSTWAVFSGDVRSDRK